MLKRTDRFSILPKIWLTFRSPKNGGSILVPWVHAWHLGQTWPNQIFFRTFFCNISGSYQPIYSLQKKSKSWSQGQHFELYFEAVSQIGAILAPSTFFDYVFWLSCFHFLANFHETSQSGIEWSYQSFGYFGFFDFCFEFLKFQKIEKSLKIEVVSIFLFFVLQDRAKWPLTFSSSVIRQIFGRKPLIDILISSRAISKLIIV